MQPSTSVELNDLLQMIGELYVQKRLVEKQLADAQALVRQQAGAENPWYPQTIPLATEEVPSSYVHDGEVP